MRVLNLATIAAALALSTALAVFLHFRVDEVDVFWQIRAGEEILHGLGVQHVDLWSHSRAGAPWHNLQWLSCVVLYAFSRLSPDYGDLPSLRMLGGIAVLFSAALSARVSLPRQSRQPLVAMLLVTGIFFSSLLPWLKLQPELFAFVCYAAMLLTWSLADIPRRHRLGATLGLLFLWAQLHAGSVLVGAFVGSAFLLFSREMATLPVARRLGFSALALVCCLLSPAGYHGLEQVASLVLLYDWSIVRNPAQASLSLEALLRGDEAGTHRLWLGLTAAVNAAYFMLWRLKRSDELPVSHSRPALFWALSALLTALAVFKLRARPYQLLYYVPVIAAAVALAFDRASRLRDGARQALTAMLCFALALGSALLIKLTYVELDAGGPASGLITDEFPVESLDFVRRVKPVGRMHNTWRHGGYLIDNLREYPVLFDSRESQFAKVYLDRNEAFLDGSPEAYENFHHKYGVNFAIVPVQPVQPSKFGGYFDPWEPVFPRQSWALVFFDRNTLVYVRRISEHRKIIEDHEFKTLHHGLPADHFAFAPGLAAELRLFAEGELNRCISTMPRSAYCHWGKAAFHARRGETGKALSEAQLAMTHARSENERAEIMMSIRDGLEHADSGRR